MERLALGVSQGGYFLKGADPGHPALISHLAADQNSREPLLRDQNTATLEVQWQVGLTNHRMTLHCWCHRYACHALAISVLAQALARVHKPSAWLYCAQCLAVSVCLGCLEWTD